MLHNILWWVLIFIAIIGFLDLKDLKIEDNENIDPVNDLIRKEILKIGKIFITCISILFIVYWLDLIFLR